MVDNISYVQGPTQVLVIIHCPYVSTASLSMVCVCVCVGGGGVVGGLCSQYLVSLGLMWAERGMGASYKSILSLWELCHLMQYTCPIFLPLISGL